MGLALTLLPPPPVSRHFQTHLTFKDGTKPNVRQQFLFREFGGVVSTPLLPELPAPPALPPPHTHPPTRTRALHSRLRPCCLIAIRRTRIPVDVMVVTCALGCMTWLAADPGRDALSDGEKDYGHTVRAGPRDALRLEHQVGARGSWWDLAPCVLFPQPAAAAATHLTPSLTIADQPAILGVPTTLIDAIKTLNDQYNLGLERLMSAKFGSV